MPPKAAFGEPRGGRRGGRGRVGGGRRSNPGNGGPPTPSLGGPSQSEGSSTRVTTPVSREPAVQRSLIPAAHVKAIGAKHPGQGTAGRQIKVFTNNFVTELNQGTIYHYDGRYPSFFSKGFTEQDFPPSPPCSW
jgi:hypothetical protein